MRITFVCLKCKATSRREMPAGKGREPQGGVVKCPRGHGPMAKERDVGRQTKGRS